MKRKDYEDICEFIANHPSTLLWNVLHDLRKNFESRFPSDTLLSICLIHHQLETRKTYSDKSTDEMVQKYFALYNERKLAQKDGKSSILLKLSQEFALPPALMGRLVTKQFLLENYNQNMVDETRNAVHLKTELAKMMKNPFQIPDERLSFEVRQCVLFDAGYGSVTDSIRHTVGTEYEDRLLKCVEALDIPYQNETDLRRLGYDKTPDIKLEIPIGVNGQVVCWIESKASFGTPETHKQYLDDQYYSYWNRFGPGLVIYWFGFVDELANTTRSQGILLMDDFPNQSGITRFEPQTIQRVKTL